MSEANEILKLIENADPKDSGTLELIDARVYEYVKGECALLNYRHCPKYTRSRDALRDIRPPNWQISISHDIGGNKYLVSLTKWGSGPNPYHCINMHDRRKRWLPTEELAELHAIIQAIEFDRQLDNKNTGVQLDTKTT